MAGDKWFKTAEALKQFVRALGANDRVRSVALQADGRITGTFRVQVGEEHWDLLASLFAEAQKRIPGLDKVLNDLDRILKTNATVGV